MVQQWPTSIKKCSNNGTTAFLHACECNHQPLSIIQFLAQQWPEVVKIKRRGNAPLMHALHSNSTSVETVALLVDMLPEAVQERYVDSGKTSLFMALKFHS